MEISNVNDLLTLTKQYLMLKTKSLKKILEIAASWVTSLAHTTLSEKKRLKKGSQ